MTRRLRALPSLVAALLMLLALPACAQKVAAKPAQKPAQKSPTEITAQAPQGTANDLVRRAIQNEDRASSSGPRYTYRLRSEKPERTVVKQMIETNEGVVARLISVNDKPPTPEQREADEKKLNKILNDPDEQSQRRKEQKEDEERTRVMVKALPDAFIYEYDGNEVVNGVSVLRLRFRPNPNFDPPARETMVYRGMEGRMWI